MQSFKGIHRMQITCVKFTPDGTKLVSAACDNHIKVIDVKTGNILQDIEHGDLLISPSISKFALSPDGKFIVIGGHSGSIFIFNLENGELEELYDDEHGTGVFGLDWAPGTQSTVATMDRSGLLYLWS